MRKDEICWMPARELSRLMRQKQLSPVEVVDAFLERIARVTPAVNAFCTVTAETAREEAREAEAMLMRRNRNGFGLLRGIPFSVKDLIPSKGARTKWGSRIFAEHISREDAPAVARMRAAGGIVLGTTNTPEFGWLCVARKKKFGLTRETLGPPRTRGGA